MEKIINTPALLKQLSKFSEKEIPGLYSVGKTALPKQWRTFIKNWLKLAKKYYIHSLNLRS